MNRIEIKDEKFIVIREYYNGNGKPNDQNDILDLYREAIESELNVVGNYALFDLADACYARLNKAAVAWPQSRCRAVLTGAEAWYLCASRGEYARAGLPSI